uniref:Uncharacterized protein n=1 Tax=Phytophthora ramorum TaxID=164328 RepID=H3H3I8_PHYRM
MVRRAASSSPPVEASWAFQKIPGYPQLVVGVLQSEFGLVTFLLSSLSLVASQPHLASQTIAIFAIPISLTGNVAKLTLEIRYYGGLPIRSLTKLQDRIWLVTTRIGSGLQVNDLVLEASNLLLLAIAHSLTDPQILSGTYEGSLCMLLPTEGDVSSFPCDAKLR